MKAEDFRIGSLIKAKIGGTSDKICLVLEKTKGYYFADKPTEIYCRDVEYYKILLPEGAVIFERADNLVCWYEVFK